MLLLDQSYFRGPLTIAQLGQQAVVDNLNDIISLHEPAILEAALGYDLSQAFLDGLDVSSGEEIEQRWIDLRDGVEFISSSNVKKKWRGLANDTTKKSAYAGLIWSHYMRDKFTQVTGIGLVKTQAENATVENPTNKMCERENEVWREMNLLWNFLTVNITTYAEFDSTQVQYHYFKPINFAGI